MKLIHKLTTFGFWFDHDILQIDSIIIFISLQVLVACYYETGSMIIHIYFIVSWFFLGNYHSPISLISAIIIQSGKQTFALGCYSSFHLYLQQVCNLACWFQTSIFITLIYLEASTIVESPLLQFFSIYFLKHAKQCTKEKKICI